MFRDDALPMSANLSSSGQFPDSTPSQNVYNENNLDDVWGSAPSSTTSESFSNEAQHTGNEPSDIPRLRSEHSTAGYRDGLSSSKNTTIQEGFDEGYGLGAVMGLEVGILLGLLEGIYNAVRIAEACDDSEKRTTYTILDRARRELRMEEVFGRDWWSEDGTWKFDVLGEGLDGTEEIVFKDVVSSHPTIRKWTELVNREAERWGLDLCIMERFEERQLGIDD